MAIGDVTYGDAGGASPLPMGMLPQVAQAYASDPRRALIQAMLEQSNEGLKAPMLNPTSAVARALTSALGSWQAQHLAGSYQDANAGATTDLQRAIAAMNGTAAGPAGPDGAAGSPASPPNFNEAMRILGSNRYLAPGAMSTMTQLGVKRQETRYDTIKSLAPQGLTLDANDNVIPMPPESLAALKASKTAQSSGEEGGKIAAQTEGQPGLITATTPAEANKARAIATATLPTELTKIGATAAASGAEARKTALQGEGADVVIVKSNGRDIPVLKSDLRDWGAKNKLNVPDQPTLTYNGPVPLPPAYAAPAAAAPSPAAIAGVPPAQPSVGTLQSPPPPKPEPPAAAAPGAPAAAGGGVRLAPPVAPAVPPVAAPAVAPVAPAGLRTIGEGTPANLEVYNPTIAADSKEVAEARDAANNGKQNVRMVQAIEDFLPTVRTGWGAADINKGGMILKSIGVPEKDVQGFLNSNPADAQFLNKQFLTLSAAAVRGMGAREPGSVINLFRDAYQNLGTDPESIKLMNNVIRMDAQRSSDLAEAKTAYHLKSLTDVRASGDYRGLKDFDKEWGGSSGGAHDPQLYMHAAEAMAGRQQQAFPSAHREMWNPTIQLMPPNTHYIGPDGQPHVRLGQPQVTGQ